MRFSHHVTSYFSIFFQPVSLVSLSQYFGDFLIMWISLPQIFLPTFRTITSPTGFPAIQTIISLLQEFTSLPLAIFPLFGHLICLPHASLPTFMPIASFTGFPALQSIFAYFLHSLSLPWQIVSIIWPIFSVYLFRLFFSVNFLATFSILWISYLICFHQLHCLLSPLLVFQPFIYPIFLLLP